MSIAIVRYWVRNSHEETGGSRKKVRTRTLEEPKRSPPNFAQDLDLSATRQFSSTYFA